ncbi:hypothetical protein KIPB_005307 [Kipferlia bialata]|uniref:Uncharacterized protein n=1 Tax=Kipferlia bialata TaxID=797122 RepID=A0A391NRD5_9EUKA|nr:hypothetical protein KIPB_005307 [Kipferlia bialata]|eukprot:g5307.t1
MAAATPKGTDTDYSYGSVERVLLETCPEGQEAPWWRRGRGDKAPALKGERERREQRERMAAMFESVDTGYETYYTDLEGEGETEVEAEVEVRQRETVVETEGISATRR